MYFTKCLGKRSFSENNNRDFLTFFCSITLNFDMKS